MSATTIDNEIKRLHLREIENEPYGSGEYEIETVITGLMEKTGLTRPEAMARVEAYFLN